VGACEQSQDLGNETVPCARDLVQCSGACVDLRSDPRHCGSCFAACAPDQVCGPVASNLENGIFAPSTCQATCPLIDGYPATHCSGGCIYFGGSSAHCGACDASCPLGTHCNGGLCDTCPIGVDLCLANGPAASAVVCLTDANRAAYEAFCPADPVIELAR